MSFKTKPQLKLYKYENSAFVLQAIIDDYQEASWEDNLYEAGTFTITINYNIPNALKFDKGLFVNFGDSYEFGEILTIADAIGSDGKGSQIRTITGRDARYILKRRVIRNMNSNGLWVMTAKGETVLRNLINDQCGLNAETKRRLPITNVIPDESGAIGNIYSVSESFTNLYEVCKTIATQSEIGWRIEFDGTNLNLVCFNGTDRSASVQFSTSYDSLSQGNFEDSLESFANTVYVGGKGQNDNKDIYEGEVTGTPSGLDRFEAWDNQSSMTTESEYQAEALSMLAQYGQTVQLSGQGLAKCPYVYEKQYFVGDKITVAFSGKSAVVQILSVTEHWSWNNYDISFSFGKPQNNLADQLQIMLRKIQSASDKTNSTDSVRWYNLDTQSSMPACDVTYNTIGFTGGVGSGKTFTLYFNSNGTGSKTYHVHMKQVTGTGSLTLSTGVSGASNLTLNVGTYVAIIYVDGSGNVISQGATPVALVTSGSTQPVTSGAVASAIDSAVGDWKTYKCSTAGYIGWILVGDITTWYNSTSESITQNVHFNGFYTTQRLVGFPYAESGFFTLSVGYFRNNSAINANALSDVYQTSISSSRKIIPCVVRYNNKYYLAFKIPENPNLNISFLVTTNIAPLFTILPRTTSVTEIFVAS